MSRLTGRLARLERARPAVVRPDLAAESAAYGELVAANRWARTYAGEQDGKPVTTLLSLRADRSVAVAYQVVGTRAGDLT